MLSLITIRSGRSLCLLSDHWLACQQDLGIPELRAWHRLTTNQVSLVYILTLKPRMIPTRFVVKFWMFCTFYLPLYVYNLLQNRAQWNNLNLTKMVKMIHCSIQKVSWYCLLQSIIWNPDYSLKITTKTNLSCDFPKNEDLYKIKSET